MCAGKWRKLIFFLSFFQISWSTGAAPWNSTKRESRRRKKLVKLQQQPDKFFAQTCLNDGFKYETTTTKSAGTYDYELFLGCLQLRGVILLKTFTENWDSKAPSVGTLLPHLETYGLDHIFFRNKTFLFFKIKS